MYTYRMQIKSIYKVVYIKVHIYIYHMHTDTHLTWYTENRNKTSYEIIFILIMCNSFCCFLFYLIC